MIAEIRAFLNGIEGQAVRMRQRLVSGKGFDHSWQDQLHQFRLTLLPEEVLVALRKAETVVVVPHHILHYFPFAALVTERDTRPRSKMQMVQPRFLIDEEFDLVHAPSLLVWDHLRGENAARIGQVNAVGIVDFPGAPRLPGVEKDLANLQLAFGSRVREILFGREATETAALELLGRPGLILFATHGSNEPDRPLDSYLMCVGDQSADGNLTAAELFVSKIRADMVIMSACYSGLADKSPLPGDDLFGIQRAFLQSGARTVVSGLWDVYDGTGPELMQGFFNSLASGTPAARALADSQRAFLEKRRASPGDPWLHPYFWSVYTLAGDGETHIQAPLLSKEDSQ